MQSLLEQIPGKQRGRVISGNASGSRLAKAPPQRNPQRLSSYPLKGVEGFPVLIIKFSPLCFVARRFIYFSIQFRLLLRVQILNWLCGLLPVGVPFPLQSSCHPIPRDRMCGIASSS